MNMKFTLNLNLDDETEVAGFIAKHGTAKGRTLANSLGLSGKGADKLATRLSCYAWNKQTAINLRREGKIQTAQQYEAICDRLYSEDINPVCNCW